MAFEKNYDVPPPVSQPACVHLRSKRMFITGELHAQETPEETGSQYSWCNLTQHIIGPDKGDVDRPSCIPGRDCFCDTR